MRITLYTLTANLDLIYSYVRGTNCSPIYDCNLYTLENAQRTHFQGWAEISIPYETYLKMEDLKQ